MAKKKPEIKIINNYPRTYTCDSLVTMIESEKATFENEIQRALVWNVRQKSLLIHSLIIGYPIPSLYAVNQGNGSLDFIDGKQRATSIFQFVNNRFKLTDIPPVKYTNGTEIDLNGYKYSSLPQEIQALINQYNITITIFDGDISPDDVKDIFLRFNNGTQLKRSDRSYALALSKSEITKICEHEIFAKALTKNAREKLTQRGIVIQCLLLLQGGEHGLMSKDTDNFLSNHEVTPEESSELIAIYDRLLSIINNIEAADNTLMWKKVMRRILSRNNMPIVANFMKDNTDDEKITRFLRYFFAGKKNASINEDYNQASIAGSGQLAHVETRKRIISEEFNKFE